MLDKALAQIRGGISSVEGIHIDPKEIGTAGLNQVIAAIECSPQEWISITFFSGFRDVANAIIRRNPSATAQKLKRLSLTFRHTVITPNDVVTLLNNPQCPLGLELSFINCIDASNREPLFSSEGAHAVFARVLDSNDKIIDFAIHTSRESSVVGEGLTHHEWLKDLSRCPAHNKNCFEFLKLIEAEKNEHLKQRLMLFLTDPANNQKLRDYCKITPYINDIYQLFKGIIELNDGNIKEGFKSLTSYFSGCKPCEHEAHQMLAEYLYGQIHMEEQFQDKLDEEAIRLRQEYLDARNRIILWLLRWSDIRKTFSPIVISCARQLLRLPDTPKVGGDIKLIITYQELCNCINKALRPDDYKLYKQTLTRYDDFNHQRLVNLNDERVQKALQAKYGTSDVAILEEIICRGQSQSFWEVIENAQRTLTSFFSEIDTTPSPSPAMAAAASASSYNPLR